MRWLAIVTVALASFVAPAPAYACDDPSGVCVDGENAAWAADSTLSKKRRSKEYKKNRKRGAVPLTVEIEGGRGSAFIDGRYLAPGESRELTPGKHDVHVRDGDQVLAQGVLTIPRKSGGVTLTVVHPPSAPPPPPSSGG